jgi:hypothetical protein
MICNPAMEMHCSLLTFNHLHADGPELLSNSNFLPGDTQTALHYINLYPAGVCI